MTGYANSTTQIENVLLQIDIRSVNHRFLDITIKCPEQLQQFEQNIYDVVRHSVVRGKIALCIQTHNCRYNSLLTPKLNRKMLQHYIEIATQIEEHIGTTKFNDVMQVITLPGVIEYENLTLATVKKSLLQEIKLTCNQLSLSQQLEGGKLSNLLSEKIQQIVKIITFCKQDMQNAYDNYQIRLKQRLKDALTEAIINETRFQLEVAYFCQKTDVDEELERLEAHCQQLKSLLDEGGIIGKKVDFIAQEMHREANTFGTKAASLNMSNQAIELKVLIEQIREQAQNIM